MNYKFVMLAGIFGILSAKSAVAQRPQINADVKKALTVASANDIKEDITYLADDRLKGRQPGTLGFQQAGDYVVEQLKKYHVLPAGEKYGWLQAVRLRKAFSADGSISLNSSALQYGKDAVIYPDPESKQDSVDAPLVFAGFGISNPVAGYDDYADIDVKGKVVIILRGAPDSFSPSIAAHSVNFITQVKTAAEHGAIGVILAVSDTLSPVLPTFGKTPVYSVLDSKDRVVVSRTYYDSQLKIAAIFSYPLITKLLSEAGKNFTDVLAALKTGHPQDVPLSLNFKASYTSSWQDINSFNIVGKIQGSDSRLRNEYIVHSAHLDHLGISTPVKGDSLYNGAHDNASGVASLLQIAKIYDALKVKPKRSILMVFVTGEELGLLGSGYFAKHPTVPEKNIVADINTDMPTIIAPLLSVTALGAEHSSLAVQVDTAAAYLGLSVEPDPEPKQSRFTRSDQYSFVVQGVPALHIKYGSKTADGKNNLNEFVAKWREKYYHKPQDDIHGIFDFEAGKKYAQLNFLIGYLAANQTNRPAWNKGDIFEKH